MSSSQELDPQYNITFETTEYTDDNDDVFSSTIDHKKLKDKRKERLNSKVQNFNKEKEEEKLRLFINECDFIKSRVHLGVSDDNKAVIAPIRRHGYILEKEVDHELKFTATFDMKGDSIDELRENVHSFYEAWDNKNQILCECVSTGCYYIAYINSLMKYVRIKVLNVRNMKISALAIDYGRKYEILENRIYNIHRSHTENDFAYHLAIECALPQWPVENSLTKIEDIDADCDVDLYILSDHEPCLTVIVPINKKSSILLNELLYYGLDEIARTSLMMILTSSGFDTPYGLSYLEPSRFPRNEWVLGVITYYESIEEVHFRDIYMSLRLAYMQQYLNKCMLDEASRESLMLPQALCVVDRPVIVYDKKTENYYRGLIKSYELDGGWTVQCVDYPEKVITFDPSKDKLIEIEGYVKYLYLMPEVLGLFPIQSYCLPAYIFAEKDVKYKYVVEYVCSSMFSKGGVIRAKLCSDTGKILMEMDNHEDVSDKVLYLINSVQRSEYDFVNMITSSEYNNDGILHAKTSCVF